MECPDNPDDRGQRVTAIIRNQPLEIINPNKFQVSLASC